MPSFTQGKVLHEVKTNSEEERGASVIRVLDSRTRGCGFEPHTRHWVVSLSKTLYPLLSTGYTKEDPFQLGHKESKQTKNQINQMAIL